MLRTGLKTPTMIDRYKEENTESESHKTEVDNGVHPLHWATSPGPSPMGTDPINGFKKVQMVLDSANQFHQYGQKSATPLLWKNTNWLSKAKKSQMKQRRQSTLYNHRNWTLKVKSLRPPL